MKLFMLFCLCSVSLEAMPDVMPDHLVINEVQVANLDLFRDHSNNYGAWVEIYNPTSVAVKLDRMSIQHTDADGETTRTGLTTTHGSVPAGGYAVLWFDHHSSTGYYGSGATKQIPYKLSVDGGRLELLSSLKEVVDAVDFPPAIPRASYIRTSDGAGAWAYTSRPTPGTSNNGMPTASQRLPEPEVSKDGTVFREPFTFTVKIPTGAKLYYTTDGSTPKAGESLVSTDGRFSVDGTTVYRFMLSASGWLDSPVATRSFIADSLGLYLPVVSVTSAPGNFFDPMYGLYVRGSNGRIANNSKTAANQNMDWERPVNVEYLVPRGDGAYEVAFNQGADFSIFGGWTRFNGGYGPFEHRSSFKLKAGKVYEGRNTVDYPMFPAKPHIKIKNFLVRNGGQDQYLRYWDVAVQELVSSSGLYVDCQASQPSHVFINGMYLGMLNLREESNKQFAMSNYGIDTDEVDQWENDVDVKAGSLQKISDWMAATTTLASSPTEANWKKVCEMIDVDEYCNYMAVEIFVGNLDWLRGKMKNVKAFCAQDDGGRIHFVLHDVDGAFGDTDMLSQVVNRGTGTLSRAFRNMLAYPPFKKQFTDAYCLMGGSVFNPQRCKPLIYSMAERTATALAWEGYDPKVKADKLYDDISFSNSRRQALLKTIRTQFGLGNTYGVKISSNKSGARILLNGQEIPGGSFEWELFPPITLTPISPAGYTFEGWNVDGTLFTTDSIFSLDTRLGLGTYNVQAVYKSSSDEATVPSIVINEVSAGNDIFVSDYFKKSDWLELYNTTDHDIDLAGMYLSDNTEKPLKCRIQGDAVGLSTVIPAHGYRVVWCDDREPLSALHASFKLKNEDGSCVGITSADGDWADFLFYDRQGRWQTFGRYSDGGTHVALFNRPTIEQPNYFCMPDILLSPVSYGDILDPVEPVFAVAEDVASREYFSLGGMHLSSPRKGEVVVCRTTYRDGSVETVKMLVK